MRVMRSLVNIVLPCLAVAIFGCSENTTNTSYCTTNPTNPACLGSSTTLTSSTALSSVATGSSTSTVKSTYAYFPTNVNAQVAADIFAQWKGKVYVLETAEHDANNNPLAIGSARLKFSTPAYTVSEAIGYGMLSAYFAGDFDMFNKLWAYHKAFRGLGMYLMDWKINKFLSYVSPGPAADADIDVATSLVLAYSTTGNQAYLADAQLVIKDIWDYFHDTNNLMLPAVGWSGIYNPSYFSPVGFRLFQKVDPSHAWSSVIDAGYAWLANVQSQSSVGLFSDWANASGVAVNSKNNGATYTYNKYYLESIRIPWRITWDYTWTGDVRAKTMMSKLAQGMSGVFQGNPDNIFGSSGIGYNLAGQPVSSGTGAVTTAAGNGNAGYIGSFCAPGMVDPNFNAWTTSCNAKLVSWAIAPTQIDYFPEILQVLYVQLLNGKYVKPAWFDQ